MTRASWLVDIGYVVKASVGRFKLDYVKAKRYLEERCGPTCVFLFNGVDSDYGISERLQAFYDSMQYRGMQVRLHPMQSGPPGTNRQRRVDVDLSAHLVWQASQPNIQSVILTTGDQDFVPAVELVRSQFAKKVVLFTYDAVVHRDLSASVDEWWHFEHEEARLARE
jgi:uncharacterized LabA/DUF88 family protein